MGMVGEKSVGEFQWNPVRHCEGGGREGRDLDPTLLPASLKKTPARRYIDIYPQQNRPHLAISNEQNVGLARWGTGYYLIHTSIKYLRISCIAKSSLAKW